jgi:hypothetical protein
MYYILFWGFIPWCIFLTQRSHALDRPDMRRCILVWKLHKLSVVAVQGNRSLGTLPRYTAIVSVTSHHWEPARERERHEVKAPTKGNLSLRTRITLTYFEFTVSHRVLQNLRRHICVSPGALERKRREGKCRGFRELQYVYYRKTKP